ncbi:MAG: hypothetical protein ACE141_14030 [Bryobacteraceae bacterium]
MLNLALELLRELRECGAEIEAADGTLRVTAPAGVLTEDLKTRIASFKPTLLELLDRAVNLLNLRGVRLIQNGQRMVVALWRDADGREICEALEVVGLVGAEVLYLDDPEAEIPERYRQFVPEYVTDLWVRQGLLATPAERLEAEARARFLNRLFDTQGTSSEPSRITSATVLHGMLARRKPRRP